MFSNSLLSGETDGITRIGVVGVMVIVLICGWRLLHPSTTFAADGSNDYWDRAVEESHDRNQPSVVLFTAGWCPACQMLHSQVLSQADIEEELGVHYTFVSVDLTHPTPAASARAKAYGISAIPTLIRFDSLGHETDRVHYLPPDEMIKWLHAGD